MLLVVIQYFEKHCQSLTGWVPLVQFEFHGPAVMLVTKLSCSLHQIKLKLSETSKLFWPGPFLFQGGGKGRHVTYRVEEGVEGPWKGSEGSWNSSSRLKKNHQAKPISEKEPEPYCFPCFRWSLIMVNTLIIFQQSHLISLSSNTMSLRWGLGC